MRRWGWRFYLAALAVAWWALLTQPSEQAEEVLDYERQVYETLACERRYFDPAVLAFEPPDRVVIREPEDVKRAFEHPRPALILFDFWPACYGDGTLREGSVTMVGTDPSEEA